MSEGRWTLAVLAVAVFGGVWYLAQKSEPPVAAAPSAATAAGAGTAIAVAQRVEPPSGIAAGEQDAGSAAAVARWIADANGGDAARRSEAISALARAPRQQALPVLHRVLIAGEPSVDRPLALRSLRELALQQGDADGKVREAIREAIYHSDDQHPGLMGDAQEALDVVEESELR
jgi:hypothetical protein